MIRPAARLGGLLLAGCLAAPDVPATGADAASMVAAAPDASAADAGAGTIDGPRAGADGGAAALVEGFEAATLDGRWTVLGVEGRQAPGPTTAVLDRSRAHGGAASLHVHDGFIETAPPATAFYGRAWVWFGADPGPGHWMAWVAVGPGGAQGTEVRYGGHYDILQANYFGNDDEVISDPKGYCAPTCDDGVAVPVGAWSCVEVYFGADEIRFWLDGTEISTLHVTRWPNRAPPWSPAYDRVRLGFHDFQGPAVDVWYDDVALGAARIGCQ
jgi:hypothetical protein